MRVRVCLLLALMPGVLAAQSFVSKRLPSLDLSPKRWSYQKARPDEKPVLPKLSFRQEEKAKVAYVDLGVKQMEDRPCSVDLSLVPHQADGSDMRLLTPKNTSRSRTAKIPAPPCSEAANERK